MTTTATTTVTLQMQAIISDIRHDRMGEAIKTFRALCGCSLKEAREALDVIRNELGIGKQTKYFVLSRLNEDSEMVADEFVDRAGAMQLANSLVGDCHQTLVAAVVAESVNTRSMQDAA